MPPVTALVLVVLLLAVTVTIYRARHDGRIFTGVSAWGVDLSGMNTAEAEAALDNLFTTANAATLTFRDPATGKEWQATPQTLGVHLDEAQTITTALAVGRGGNPLGNVLEMFQSWYFGRAIAPIMLYDEAQVEQFLDGLAAEIEQPATSAMWDTSSGQALYVPGRAGRQLDRAYVRERLVEPVSTLRPANVELLIHEIYPPVYDAPAEAAKIQEIAAQPVTFYFAQPLADVDLAEVMLPAETLTQWLRVEMQGAADGVQSHQVRVDENAARNWLQQFADQVYRAPVNARYYFNDDTRELVLVAPHVNGRELDVEATLAQFLAQFGSGNHRIPFVLNEIVPVAHSGATGTELGITELITETTTWFYGSSDARKHNIARAAANFFGIVVAPGEEFSFNRYLGSVSETDGYEEGFIIVGGRTFRGIGGGVCQVSTTIYQTAFWAGFPIVERWEHGYLVGYYNDGEGPGMDATVYSPIVDFRFINNTPHHLLIENYYNTEFESLTFKFYSTSMGRRVVKEEPVWSNIVPAPTEEQDQWVFDPNVPPGTVQQIDWAVEGADISVRRIVYNANDEVLIDHTVNSHYIPNPNVFHYGEGVEPGDYSLVPEEDS
jgi:vancomycin resistance protein YoaR